ncbi:hypothetical protein, partial [Escherichia coli]|uniref:hypothetical protein n=1 Tax=Escherichia coli TaxID=562 RepID=UPI001BC830E7
MFIYIVSFIAVSYTHLTLPTNSQPCVDIGWRRITKKKKKQKKKNKKINKKIKKNKKKKKKGIKK